MPDTGNPLSDLSDTTAGHSKPHECRRLLPRRLGVPILHFHVAPCHGAWRSPVLVLSACYRPIVGDVRSRDAYRQRCRLAGDSKESLKKGFLALGISGSLLHATRTTPPVHAGGRVSPEPAGKHDAADTVLACGGGRAQRAGDATATVPRFRRRSIGRFHMQQVSLVAVIKERPAARLHATLLGHALGHDEAIVKKCSNIRMLCE